MARLLFLSSSMAGLLFAAALKHPSAVVIAVGIGFARPYYPVALSIFLAIVSSKIIWATTLLQRDTAALGHLGRKLRDGGKVRLVSLQEYDAKLAMNFQYHILLIERYPTYAAVQYASDRSFIVVPFSPEQPNQLRLFWLLHECGHIGATNRSRGLYLEVSRFLAMGIFAPGVIVLGNGAVLYTLVLAIVGGVLVGVSQTAGRLYSEIEADHFAIKLAAEKGSISGLNILQFEPLMPPPDRKMSEDLNEIRSRTFHVMLTDARSNRLLPLHAYIGPVAFIDLSVWMPLIIFLICMGLLQHFRDPIDLQAATTFLAVATPIFFLMYWLCWYQKRNALKEVFSLVAARSV